MPTTSKKNIRRNNFHWTCIAVTCGNKRSASAIHKELEILKKHGEINESTIVTVIVDPAPSVGSGGATLNALLVIAEKLSAKYGYPVISSEVLTDSRILILHMGREYLFDHCGKAFVTLPNSEKLNDDSLTSPLYTNLQLILIKVEKWQSVSGPGLWVCSTDMILTMDNSEMLNFDDNPDGLMICIPAHISYAVGHGSVLIDSKSFVKNILYGASERELRMIFGNEETVPLVAGIVYLSPAISEIFLSFHQMSPLDCCTYMGLDSGAKYLQVSLFFDILLAMSTGLNKDDFIMGNCGKDYNKKLLYKTDLECEKLMKLGRTRVYETLKKFNLKAVCVQSGKHAYLADKGTVQDHLSTIKSITTEPFNHSIFQGEIGAESILINSKLSTNCSIGSSSVIQHTILDCHATIEDRCYISSINLASENRLTLKSDMCLLSYPINYREGEKFTSIIVVFGNGDQIFTPAGCASATFCNQSLESFMKRTGIMDTHLWPENLPKDGKTLYNARMYPVVQDMELISWLQDDTLGSKYFERWENQVRLSLGEIMELLNVETALQSRREIFADITCEMIESVLSDNSECHLVPYFELATSQGWSNKVLSSLDKIATQIVTDPQSKGNLKRVLFCIADLLGGMGGNDVGFRSGPAGNKDWNEAFILLDNGRNDDAVKFMYEVRAKWINTPEELLRAARHYEKAAHHIIRRDVNSVTQIIHLSEGTKSAIGAWVTSECPARVDMMGGWTDTPPHCYENMGSVVDIAFKLNGEKHIGSKGRRIEPLKIIFVLHAEHGVTKTVEVQNIEDMLDYCRPHSPAALLKTAVIAIEIVDIRSEESLQTQLKKNLGSGLELHTWAFVPQGSGLGTSSILAGTICSTIWVLAGNVFTRKDLIHVVLLVEQLATTGGGWQDAAAGITGGICNGVTLKGLPIEVNMHLIKMTPEKIVKLNQHLLLIYTGTVRLARNILQNSIRNFYAHEKLVLNCYKGMLSKVDAIIEAIQTCDLNSFGKLLDESWELKKIVAPGCEPARVRNLMNDLIPYVYGQTLAGAGGGGFLCIITKKPNDIESITNVLNDFGYTHAKIYPSSIDTEGIEVNVDGTSLLIPHC